MPHSDSPSGETEVDKTLAGTAEPVVTPDANAQAAVTSDAADQGAKPELSLDDVIKASLKPEEAAADTPADGKGTKDTDAADEAADEAPVEKTDAEKEAEEDAKVPFHKHPRWQKKLEIERDLRAKLSTFEQEAEPLREKAGQMDLIGNFMVTNSLTPEEMTEGLAIMALMKRDPVAALEALRPKLESLEIASGERFPADIQDKVDAGKLDAEAAAELTRSRFMAQANAAKAEVATDRLEQTTVQTTTAAMKTAVQTWEADLKTRDPDYSHKQSFVIDRTRVLAQATPPRSPKEAVDLAQKAYDDVSAQMKRFVPQPKPTATTVTSDKSSTRSDPVPQSLADIVRQNIAR